MPRLKTTSAAITVFISALTLLAGILPSRADEASDAAAAPTTTEAATERYSLHGQFTNVTQMHTSFTSPFRGTNSLDPGTRGNESVAATLFAGIRLSQDLEFYANPEIDQGFGLSNTVGMAGFPNGVSGKVGEAQAYARVPRAFFRYTLGLGGERETIEPDANQLGGARDKDNVTVTFGKFSVVDIFDTNTYAHDPTQDFLNWSIIDAGAFDYAADAWGYSYGGAAEWTQSWWTLRAGVFDMSRQPNGQYLERGFGQFEEVVEAEERHRLLDHPGKLKILFYENHADMANYNDAVRLGRQTASTPDVSLVRRYSTRPGMTLNAEQEMAPDVGIFARASLNDGHKEAYEFTEINRSVAAGVSVKGDSWSRPNDTVGLAGVVNEISSDARNYLAAGGLGILIGDGQLPRNGPEEIAELYYDLQVIEGVNVSVDYQRVANPAYNAARGPVDIMGFRVHAEF
jgi:high affinity Mn2+ porin